MATVAGSFSAVRCSTSRATTVGASDSWAVQRREIQAMPTSTATRATLTSSSCPYEVPVSADQDPTWRHDW